jgi:hypothetical protein
MNISKLGAGLAAAYVALCAYLLYSQGLFGESFVALILGLPWSLFFSFFEFFNAGAPFVYILLFAPMILNAFLLYWGGNKIGKRNLQ